MTGGQLASVLTVASLATAAVLAYWVFAWAERARHRADEARERRLLAELELRRRASDEERAASGARHPSLLPAFEYRRVTTAPVPPTDEPEATP